MQTSKASHPTEHQTNAVPASKAAVTPAPPSLSKPSLSLASRPTVPSLFLSDAETRAMHQSGNAVQSTSPRSGKGDPSPTPDKRENQQNSPAAESTVASGIKRARDGKDGPARKSSKADKDEKHGKPKSSEKSRVNASEEPKPDDAETNAKPLSKRARTSTVSRQPGKAHRPKPVDQGASQAGPLLSAAKVTSAPTQVPDNALPESGATSPVAWKHGTQSPRANSGSRASLTLSPRRSSNASACERVSPARQGEDAIPGQQAAANINAAATLQDIQAFTFSPCDSDEDGVIGVEPGSGPTLPGKEAQADPGAAQSAAYPGPDAGPATESEGGAAPVQQGARQQPGLTSDMTALLDDLDAALDQPIGM